jgi:signal transduction histidine kinase
VDDTGCGIPPERLEKIFEPFFSTKERGGGTGLGMAIVEDIARAHGAAIEIESGEGRGTTIWLRWPAAGAGTETAGNGDSEALRAMSAPTGDA